MDQHVKASRDLIWNLARFYKDDYPVKLGTIESFREEFLTMAYIRTDHNSALIEKRQKTKNATLFVHSSLASSITDLTVMFTEEFKDTVDHRFDYTVIKYSILYPFSYDESVSLAKAYIKYCNRLGYYPSYVIKRSKDKDIYHTYTYFYIFFPLYNFKEHRRILANTSEYEEIIRHGKSKFISILSDDDSKVSMDALLLHEIAKKHDEVLGKPKPNYQKSSREAMLKEIDEKGYIDCD